MKEKKQMGLNIGSASIIMLFSVLCLTVLASLSLLSANSQWRLAQRSKEAVSAYYAADTEAVRIYEALSGGSPYTGESGDAELSTYTDEDGNNYVSYSVPIDENQTLSVVLLSQPGSAVPRIVEWKAVDSGNWNPDTALEVWSGD